MSSDVIGVEWQSPGGTAKRIIGYVLIKDKHNGELKCYCGIGDGIWEDEDIHNIRTHGGKVRTDVALAIFGSRYTKHVKTVS